MQNSIKLILLTVVAASTGYLATTHYIDRQAKQKAEQEAAHKKALAEIPEALNRICRSKAQIIGYDDKALLAYHDGKTCVVPFGGFLVKID